MPNPPLPPFDDLPRLREWQAANGPHFTLGSLLESEGNLDLVVAHAAFFWPEFVEVDGCVLFKDRYSPDNLSHWMESLSGDLSRVESMINHTHFYNLGLNDERGEEQTLASYEYVANVAMRTWRAALAEQFPGKTFEFHLATEPDDYGPTLYFWQVRAPISGDSP